MKALERRISRVELVGKDRPELTRTEREQRLSYILKYGDPQDPRVKRIRELINTGLARGNTGKSQIE